VAAMENAGNPHYQPQAGRSRAIGPDELVLIDLWGKLPKKGAIFADITWVAFTGGRVPDEQARVFAAAAAAREAALALTQEAARRGADLRGWQVDRAARTVIIDAGYGAQILHRTGHSLGETVHGNGVHMDDYETHDDRRLLPGTGFTLEPGIYFPHFGVRTEINVYFDTGDARPSGPRQGEIVTLG
jgi:Xaa-Pro dipeptidase